MTPYHVHAQGGRCGPHHSPGQDLSPERVFPLHRLSNICCSTGACRDVDYRAMGLPQEGWLQLNQDPEGAAPVDLVAFSSRGVSVALSAAVSLQQGEVAELLTQAHGAGLSHRLVRCCWHRPHPQDPSRQLAGLRFSVE